MSPLRPTAPVPSRRRTFSLAGIAAAALTALAAACADAPSAPIGAERTALAPAAAPRREVVEPAVYADGLQRLVALDAPITTQVVIDKHGGKYRLPAGLQLEVEPTTFDTTVTLSVTALAGKMVAYEFQPHGLTFKKALKLQQDLRQTNWVAQDLGKIEIGYFASLSEIFPSDNKALIREFLRATIDTKGQKLQFDVFHFSGYMVSTGRQGESGDDGVEVGF